MVAHQIITATNQLENLLLVTSQIAPTPQIASNKNLKMLVYINKKSELSFANLMLINAGKNNATSHIYKWGGMAPKKKKKKGKKKKK